MTQEATTNGTPSIPKQLVDAGARFILVDKPSLTRRVKGRLAGKNPFETEWEKHTYNHDDKILVDWLAEGGNYGVISHAGIGTLDIDDFEDYKSLGLVIPDTYTDCRENKRYHVYYKCDNIPDEFKAHKTKTTWGDIRFPGHNSMVVGTNCISPNNNEPAELHQYVMYNASQINTLDWSVLKKIVETKHENTGKDDSEIKILDDVDPKKEPYVMKDGVKKNHYTIISYVGKEMATAVPIPAIHAACQSMNDNGYFDRTRTPDELTKEVDSAIKYSIRMQNAKKEDKEKKKTERVILLPNGVITPEMKKILDTHHPNAAIAHCLNKLIGTEDKDGGTVRWDTDQQSWFVWDGKVWQKEPDGLSIIKYAESFLFRAMEDAAKSGNESFLKRLLTCQSIGNVRSAMGYLQGMTAVKDDIFDSDDNLFNVMNGTINLLTGECLHFKKENFITRIGNVEFNKNATSSMWDEHLKLVIPDEETRKSFQIYTGYTLVAGNGENTALFLYGSGKNGKTETVLTISDIFGTYTLNAQANTFYMRKYDESPRPDIARLKGPRFITIPEGAQGKVIDEGLLKQLTGGDVVTARFLYGREFDFIPKGKLVFFTNHLPKIQGRDPGIWRRIFPVPFEQTVPKDKRIKDYHKRMIELEGSGILNWILNGLVEYRKNGLKISDAINAAKGTYKAREDVLAEFMGMFVVTGDHNDTIPRADLYASYVLWSGGDLTVKPFGKAKFNTLIEERVGSAIQKRDGWYWPGVRKMNTGETGQQATFDSEW
jgi:P4 family phage/plasmid primase-like protien